MDFSNSMAVAASGMRAQSDRMKVIAENIANANSTSPVKGGDPYRRKIATITQNFDNELGATLVEAGKPLTDKSDFKSQYDPGNPNADKQGYVKLPNVDSLVEIMDMREAQRPTKPTCTMMQTSKQMMASTVDLLK